MKDEEWTNAAVSCQHRHERSYTMLRRYRFCIITCLALLLGSAASALAIGSISDTQKYIWSETGGWLNGSPTNSGVVFYPDHLEGFLWAENLGWIKLGSNSSGGNKTYANNAADNWGVNRNGNTLSGYGWSETSGWINFAPTGGGVSLDADGILDGYAWGENIGWIHIRNTNPAIAYGPVLAPPVTLTATVSGSGTVTTNIGDGTLIWNASTGTGSYLRGTQLLLSAAGSGGYLFSAWGTACSGTDPCSLTLDSDKTVSASFVLPNNVRIGSSYYATLAAAYSDATDNAIIQMRDMNLPEGNLVFNRSISLLTLQGGYGEGFGSQTGYSSIDGSLTLSGTGKVIIDRIIIK